MSHFRQAKKCRNFVKLPASLLPPLLLPTTWQIYWNLVTYNMATWLICCTWFHLPTTWSFCIPSGLPLCQLVSRWGYHLITLPTIILPSGLFTTTWSHDLLPHGQLPPDLYLVAATIWSKFPLGLPNCCNLCFAWVPEGL